ncbi:MAG: UV DNA damage repair endonuclease UvsE [Bacteroidia bacterium]|nr:UV DNA damage repair endonuclease UvsE [Bacteroidia bacterium]
MFRLGLCCKFKKAPIKFRTTTATAMLKRDRGDALRYISELCLHNASALQEALHYCSAHHIGAFRINSQILPLKTHPDAGYKFEHLPNHTVISSEFKSCGRFASEHDIRLSFHPDQFVLLSSLREDVTRKSIEELSYQALVASWVGADVINIHGGGAYGDKESALKRVAARINQLPEPVRTRLTIENDDRVYTPADLLPLCRETGIPFVYDIHHHRCLPDDLTVEQATQQALATWNREPLFHISSPKNGWNNANPKWHHDYIQTEDIPDEWRGLHLTVDVEAKAKELAVEKLYRHEVSA